MAVLAVLVSVGGGYALYLNSKLSDVESYTSQLDESQRVPPPRPPAEGEPAVNILLLGVDKSSGQSVAELAGKKWVPGSMRSDTMMLVHIPADRSSVYVMSFPRDSWVTIPGRAGKDKINAAFSYGGPDLALQTIEQHTQVHIDHVVTVDWAGFVGVTDAIGGVTIHEPGVGAVQMDGAQALDYVRERKTLPGGDFDRIKRQQNFMRAVMSQTLESVSITSPGTLADILSVVADNTTVDASLTPSVMRSLGWQLRGVRAPDVVFMTVPTTGLGNENGASVVYLDEPRCAELFAAVKADLLPDYLTSHPIDGLPDPSQVN